MGQWHQSAIFRGVFVEQKMRMKKLLSRTNTFKTVYDKALSVENLFACKAEPFARSAERRRDA